MQDLRMHVHNEVDVEHLSLAKLLYRALIGPDLREQQVGAQAGRERDRKKPEARKYL